MKLALLPANLALTCSALSIGKCPMFPQLLKQQMIESAVFSIMYIITQPSSWGHLTTSLSFSQPQPEAPSIASNLPSAGKKGPLIRSCFIAPSEPVADDWDWKSHLQAIPMWLELEALIHHIEEILKWKWKAVKQDVSHVGHTVAELENVRVNKHVCLSNLITH